MAVWQCESQQTRNKVPETEAAASHANTNTEPLNVQLVRISILSNSYSGSLSLEQPQTVANYSAFS